MHPHVALIHRFYTAFAERDHQGMIACYHPEIHFRDEAFDLQGKRAGAMWHMLCERGVDLTLTHSQVQADDQTGSAHWVANYSFGPKKRPVHNEIDASFTFEDGLIKTHHDRFDFWRWSRQALGPIGMALGWSEWLRRKVATQADRNLERFVETHPAYQR